MSNITYNQKTTVYCCQCKKSIVVSEVAIPEGADFYTCNPLAYGWKMFVLNEEIHYLCPKHTLGIHIVVDNKPYTE